MLICLTNKYHKGTMISSFIRMISNNVSSIDIKLQEKMTKWSNNSPMFALSANKIEIIYEPCQFFEKLKELSLSSKKRITISSLYIGTGTLENQLVSCFKRKLDENPNIKLRILLDYNRGTRVNDKTDNSSSKSLLLPLVKNGAYVSFYLTPKMSGWRKYFVQSRQKWNELVSLHHIKCYIFDNNIIISGANLNDQYFTDRQDRYILFRDCQNLCDYFDELVNTISTFSLNLNSNGDFQLHDSWSLHPLKFQNRNKFCKEAENRINQFKHKFSSTNCDNVKNCDTLAIPLLQLKTFKIDDDEKFTINLLNNIPPVSKLNNISSVSKLNKISPVSNLNNIPPVSNIRLATGYFNLTNNYKNILLNTKFDNGCDILMASEQANGFLGSKGLIGYIPFVYTHLTKMFFRETKRLKSNISLYYYFRPNWTFHAKGLWLVWDSDYYISMIGSPNFGYRSIYRDSEVQLVILTCNDELKQNFENEWAHLSKNSSLILDENQFMHVPFWVTLVAKFFKSYY